MDAATTEFDPLPLPHRPVQWHRALRALGRLRESVDSDAIYEFRLSIEGNQGEQTFQDFLRTGSAAALLCNRPDLGAILDDWPALDRLPHGSLGRRFVDLARQDGIRVLEIARETHGAAGESERAPDPVRRWHRDRLAASHDLLHTLTGYGRDIAGEAALLAFSLGFAPIRIFWLSLVLALLGAPKRRPVALTRYLYRAWKRGRSAKISLDIHWEELLAAPFDEARARLAIVPVQTVHPEGAWCGDRGSREWRPERDAN